MNTFSSPEDCDFPELKLHDRCYNPLKESINQYYFDKVRLCIKMDTSMPHEKLVKHVIKGLLNGWSIPAALNKGSPAEDLLAKLQDLDE